jgi:hypothetical protein
MDPPKEAQAKLWKCFLMSRENKDCSAVAIEASKASHAKIRARSCGKADVSSEAMGSQSLIAPVSNLSVNRHSP